MAQCPKCGSQVADGARFCAACGAAIDSVQSAPTSPISPPPLQAQPSPAGQSGMAPNIAAMLTYVPVCLIGLVCAILFGFILDPYKKDRFVRFHAWQSLALQVAVVVFLVGWSIISAMLTFISRFFALLTFPVSMLVGLGALVLMIFLMFKAYKMESFKLPGIGDWAEKQADR